MAKHIIFIKRDGFDWFAPETRANYTFAFSQAAVQDLEVLNDKQLMAEVTNFIQTNRLVPGVCDIILSDGVVFSRDFTKEAGIPETSVPLATITAFSSPSGETSLEQKIQSYLKSVPFDNVASKTIRIANGFRVVAANTDLYRTLADALKNLKFVLEAVVPVAFLTGTLQNPPSLTETVIQLTQNTELLRQNNFLMVEKHEVKPQVEQQAASLTTSEIPSDSSKPDKKRLYILGGVFGLLFLVLAIMVYTNFIARPKPKPLSQVQKLPVTQAVTTVPSPQIPSQSAVEDKTIPITIQTNAASSISATIRNGLQAAGYSNVTIEQGAPQTLGTVVAFDSRITQGSQSAVYDIVRNVSASAKETQVSFSIQKIVITLGSN